MKNLIILIFVFCILSFKTIAEKTHGISMHGKPKYPDNFTHLE